jgi:hypothetical protein
MKEGSSIDGTILEAPSSTKNKHNQRDPKMHQRKKGNQWHFGLKAHIWVDVKTGLTYTLQQRLPTSMTLIKHAIFCMAKKSIFLQILDTVAHRKDKN